MIAVDKKTAKAMKGAKIINDKVHTRWLSVDSDQVVSNPITRFLSKVIFLLFLLCCIQLKGATKPLILLFSGSQILKFSNS